MKVLKSSIVVLFWLLIWHLVSLLVGNPVLLCSPIDVVITLARDIVTVKFWSSIGFSMLRVGAGFMLALICGLLLGALSWRISILATLVSPVVQIMKSVPIVCFIVLLLIWFGSAQVSTFAVFLVAFPALYFSTIQGLDACDQKLLEMLKVFQVPSWRQFFALYWPTMLPFLIATARNAVGMSWKAGVAAELIGLPLGSIGENIYQAKITLSSADLFAWTLVIIILSMICERVFLWLLKRTDEWSWRLALPRLRKTTERLSASKKHELHMADVSKHYDKTGVINHKSLSIRQGDRIGLRSPSGSGKTTLLMLLSGLIKPDSGSVESNMRISMVFQESRLFEKKSALDNILLISGDRCSTAQIKNLLEEVLPDQDYNKPVSQFSGGQRRRIEIVRALIATSQMVILDEPFSGLDNDTRSFTQLFINEHIDDRALVLASHDSRDFKALGVLEPDSVIS